MFSQTGGHAIVDVFGYVTGPSSPSSTDGLFVPLAAPVRFADTRTADNNPLGPAPTALLPRWTAEVAVLGRAGVPASASLIASNTTYVQATNPGYLSVAAAGTPLPATSAVNATTSGQIVANHTTIPVGTRGVAVFSYTGGHVVLDVSGYFTGAPQPSVLPVPANPTGGPPAARWSTSATRPPAASSRRRCSPTRPTGSTPSTPGWASQDIRLEIKGARSIVETLPGDVSAYQVAQNVRARASEGAGCCTSARPTPPTSPSRPAGSTGWPASTA